MILVEFIQLSGNYVALSPKSYIAKDDQGNIKQSQKGVTSRSQSSMEEYLNCLYNNETVIVDTCQLLMKKNKMTRISSQKKALNNKFYKFNLDQDGIIAKPLKI